MAWFDRLRELLRQPEFPKHHKRTASADSTPDTLGIFDVSAGITGGPMDGSHPDESPTFDGAFDGGESGGGGASADFGGDGGGDGGGGGD